MKIAYCIACGNKFPKEAQFCPYCGTKIYNPTAEGDVVTEESKEELPVVNEISITEELDVANSVDETVGDASLEMVAENKVETIEAEEKIEEENQQPEEELEKPLTGVCIISACFPMIGFIAALCNIGSNKRKAKVYALCALGGFTFGFLSGLLQVL